MSQSATTPTSAALSGRKRSEPSRAAARSPLTAELVVARMVGGDGGLAYFGISGGGISRGGDAASVAVASESCDGGIAMDIDMVDD